MAAEYRAVVEAADRKPRLAADRQGNLSLDQTTSCRFA